MLKNKTEGYTESWKRERDRLLNFYKTTPFYGGPIGEKFYKIVKAKVNIVQASVCGSVVQVTCYKQDVANVRHIMATAFNVYPKEMECHYTGLVTVHCILKSKS